MFNLIHDANYHEVSLIMPELSVVLSFTILSFIANSAFLTFYFSDILSGFGSQKAARKDGFMLSLAGSVVGATFSLIIALIPLGVAFPIIDITVGLVFITWVVLIHYRFNEAWLEAIVQSIVGIILYVVIIALLNGFFILWMSM